MLKFWLLATAVVAVCIGFSSCSKSDDNDTIIGKWKLSGISSSDGGYDATGCAANTTLEFFDDGRCEYKDGCSDSTEEGSWAVDDDGDIIAYIRIQGVYDSYGWRCDISRPFMYTHPRGPETIHSPFYVWKR